MNGIIWLILLAALLAVLLAVLVMLLRENRQERVSSTNKKIILHGGKNVNPEAPAAGDGIIGEDMSREDTYVRRQTGRRQVWILCLTEIKSQTVYKGRFSGPRILVGRRDRGTTHQETGVLYLDDPKVSRVHCRIYEENGGWMVEDCQSVNHTWVNGRKIMEPGVLQDGDMLKLASRSYQVKFLTEYWG